MIQVIDLHKSFGKLEVLKGINCRIAPREVVCVIGPSGSGKSTLLRCVNQLEHANKGQIFIDGEEITSPKTDINKIRQQVGMVFQLFNLFPIKPPWKISPWRRLRSRGFPGKKLTRLPMNCCAR